jgi:hypothetical protein
VHTVGGACVAATCVGLMSIACAVGTSCVSTCIGVGCVTGALTIGTHAGGVMIGVELTGTMGTLGATLERMGGSTGGVIPMGVGMNASGMGNVTDLFALTFVLGFLHRHCHTCPATPCMSEWGWWLTCDWLYLGSWLWGCSRWCHLWGLHWWRTYATPCLSLTTS